MFWSSPSLDGPARRRTRDKALVLAALTLLWVILLIARGFSLNVEEWAALLPLRCPLRWLLGIPCPTCGLGRSLIAAALLHPAASWRYHPLGLPLFWGGQAVLLARVFGRGYQLTAQTLPFGRQPKLVWLLAIAYGVWGFCLRR